MTKQEFFKFHQEMCARMLAVCEAKNADYTGGNQDTFANFKTVEALGACSAEQGFLTRMSDKLSRLSSLLSSGKAPAVADEKVEDTLLDLANYCVLLAGYIKNKPGEGPKAPAYHVMATPIEWCGVPTGCVVTETRTIPGKTHDVTTAWNARCP